MKRRKTIITTLLAIFLIAATMFTLTACGGGKAGSVAGTYTNEIIDGDGKIEITLDVKKDGGFSYLAKESGGLETSEYGLTGTMSVDENKKITSIELNDIANALLNAKNTFLGNILPAEELDSSYYLELSAINGIIGDYLKQCVIFGDDYVMLLVYGGNIQIMYKEGAEKLAKDTVVQFYTEKDAMDLEGSLSFISGYKRETYETDYYFVKDAFDLTDSTGKSDFIEELTESSYAFITDRLGNVEAASPEIQDVSDFDLTTAGKKTGVIKYKSAGSVVEKQVTYTVVEAEEDLPCYQLKNYELVNDNSTYELDDVTYVAANTELFSLGWRIKYNTFDSSTYVYEQINEENCTGDAKVIDIVGYDKTKTGYQLITVKYKGIEIEQSIFVYSDTVNPVVYVYSPYGSKVVITAPAEGSTDVYTADYTNAKIKIVKADGTETEETVAKVNAVNMDELKNYENGDEITFAYQYVFDGVTYTFYFDIQVEVK